VVISRLLQRQAKVYALLPWGFDCAEQALMKTIEN
jgi:hypothetical protein